MSKTLITGATGGLGSAVATFLKSKGTEDSIAVLVRDSSSEKAKALAAQGFELRVADYDDRDSLEKAFSGIDKLYFVSGSDLMNRRKQHNNVVETAKKSAVGHIFYTSVSLNNLSEDSPLYPAMSDHLITEEWIKDSGINYTFLRHNLYSEVIPMFLGSKEQVLGSKVVYLPTGEGRTAFVARQDLAEAGANALAHPAQRMNGAYELNSNEKVSFQEVADALSATLAEFIAYVSPTPEDFAHTMNQHGVPAEAIGMMSAFGVAIADGVFDAPFSDLETLLGRKPLPVSDYLKQVYG